MHSICISSAYPIVYCSSCIVYFCYSSAADIQKSIFTNNNNCRAADNHRSFGQTRNDRVHSTRELRRSQEWDFFSIVHKCLHATYILLAFGPAFGSSIDYQIPRNQMRDTDRQTDKQTEGRTDGGRKEGGSVKNNP